ncbi:hypothetical protein OHS58_32405 [Amycolatopsis sp. NBC_00348]|uniref:hypothetical protein n=1 Tax=Amycolatopsis sp. NBC_00348 TaxID=2975956 RepID=UPI002E25DDDF
MRIPVDSAQDLVCGPLGKVTGDAALTAGPVDQYGPVPVLAVLHAHATPAEYRPRLDLIATTVTRFSEGTARDFQAV